MKATLGFLCLFVAEVEASFLLHPFKLDLSPGPGAQALLYWRPDYDHQRVDLALEVTSASEIRWVALGLSDIGKFEGSDLCLFTGDDVKDSWVDVNGAIRTDRKQDCDDFQHDEFPNNRHVYRFSRKLDTCDEQDIQIKEETSLITILIGQSYRRNVNAASVLKKITPNRLLRTAVLSPPMEPGVSTFVVRPEPFRLPAQKTTYWCNVFRLPQMPSRHHVVKYEAAVEAGHEMNVHHMEVYHCELDVRRMPRYNGPCGAEERPSMLQSCRRVLAAWAMGAAAFAYPAEAGLPIGGPGYFPFVMIETHYDNPHKRKDIIDRSGIRFYVTEDLRPNDAGILEVGVTYTDHMAIPPRQPGFSWTGHCTPECSDVGLSGEGIKIFGTQLHSHSTGHRLRTIISREGEEIINLNEDTHFVTHYQEIRHLRQHVPFMPGDSMQTTCSFNTEDRRNVTLGGLGIEEEMCVNYIHYYPKSRLEVCKSAIELDSLKAYFDGLRRVKGERTSRGAAVAANYGALRWDDAAAARLRLLYDAAPIHQDCFAHNGDPLPGNWTSNLIPEISRHIPEAERDCPVSNEMEAAEEHSNLNDETPRFFKRHGGDAKKGCCGKRHGAMDKRSD